MNSLLSALALLVYGSACAGSPAVFRRTLVRAAPSERSVVVLLDREPELPFVVLGELSAVALESPTSVAMMQREAALQGLDGRRAAADAALSRERRCPQLKTLAAEQPDRG